jgi:hypothetical protein
MPPVNEVKFVGAPNVSAPPTDKSPAPERLPLKIPPFTVTALPDAIATVPPIKVPTVEFAFALNVPEVCVVTPVVPFAVTEAPLSSASVFPEPLSVTVPEVTFPRVALPVTVTVADEISTPPETAFSSPPTFTCPPVREGTVRFPVTFVVPEPVKASKVASAACSTPVLATLASAVAAVKSAVAPDAIERFTAAFNEPTTVNLVPDPLTDASPVNVLLPASVVEPKNSTLPEPEITPLEAPPEMLTVAPLDTAMFPPPRLVTLVVPEFAFTVPALASVIVPPLDSVRVPPEIVVTVPPLDNVKSPEDKTETVELSESDNVPALKFVTSTFPEMVPDAVKVPMVAKLPRALENLVLPVPESDNSETVSPLKISGVVPEALLATAPRITFSLNSALPVPLRLNAFPLNNAFDVRMPPVPTAMPPVNEDTFVGAPNVNAPPTDKSPAPERLPLKFPPFTVTVLPDAIATVPPFKALTVALAFALSVPAVNVVIVFVFPFNVTVPALTDVMLLLSPFRVKLPPERVPSVKAPAALVEPPPERVPRVAAPLKAAVAPRETSKLFPFFNEPETVSVPAVTEVLPV